MADLLSHVLLAYAVLTVLSWRVLVVALAVAIVVFGMERLSAGAIVRSG